MAGKNQEKENTTNLKRKENLLEKNAENPIKNIDKIKLLSP